MVIADNTNSKAGVWCLMNVRKYAPLIHSTMRVIYIYLYADTYVNGNTGISLMELLPKSHFECRRFWWQFPILPNRVLMGCPYFSSPKKLGQGSNAAGTQETRAIPFNLGASCFHPFHPLFTSDQILCKCAKCHSTDMGLYCIIATVLPKLIPFSRICVFSNALMC